MNAEDVAKRVRELTAEGELLAAVDFARRWTRRFRTLDQRQLIQLEEVVALARMASLEEARERYDEYALEDALPSRARSLKARFLKDLAFAAEDGAERRRLLADSRNHYLAITREIDPAQSPDAREQYEYNGVNAVSLSKMIGDLAPVADIVETLRRRAPRPSYWSWVTRAELLLATGGADEEIDEALTEAVSHDDALPGNRATTLMQLRRLAPGHKALERLKPGPVVHYSGHMIAPRGAAHGRILWKNQTELKRRVDAELDRLRPSMMFGSLASGVDITAVEWAVRNGCEARILLPFAKAGFFARSIAPAGRRWEKRARICMRATTCQTRLLTTGDAVEGDDWAFNAVATASMGAAILRAERIGAEAVQLLVWDGEDAGGVAGSAADRRIWTASGRTRREVDIADLGRKAPKKPAQAPPRTPPRVPRALVFGDVKNFSKLSESQLPVFVETVMGAVAEALAAVAVRYGGEAISFSNTWGDGVFAVFDRAAPAAFFALEIQRRMSALKPRLPALGLPADLAIRLGLHYGVVFPMREPVTKTPNFFGEAVARAARIEPITRAGAVFVSEEFAAALALDPKSPAIAEYVGEVDTAKKYGRFRLYRIKPR